MSKAFLRALEQVVNLPTAPFAEGYVATHVRQFVARRPRLHLKADRFGNLLVTVRPKAPVKTRGRPVLFAAHMDHPGFIAGPIVDGRRMHADWHGGVQSRYFKNEKIRFFVDGRWVRATIETVVLQKPKKGDGRTAGDMPPKAVIVRVAAPVPVGSLGMWDIKDAVIRGHRIHARVTDDLSGLAAVLCALDVICRRGARVRCHALFTRAEEVGFAGALAALEAGTVPKNAMVVAVENSAVIPGVSMGAGPVLRVGDKASVFSPAVTAYCQRVADDLAKRDGTFQYQRKLMDGGSCEATAFCHHGYEANCICLPLANYHNMDTKRRKIAPESIDVRDYVNLVKWFIALAASPAKLTFGGPDPTLGKRLDALLKQHRRQLERTATPAG